MKTVYVASAYSGDMETNVEKTKAYSRFVIRQGAVPINPILNLHGVLSEETDRRKAMNIDLHLLKLADEVWAFGDPTPGMQVELLEANALGKKVRFYKKEDAYAI